MMITTQATLMFNGGLPGLKMRKMGATTLSVN